MQAQVDITLSPGEKKHLEQILNSRKSSARLIERSRIVLLAASSTPNYKIAEALNIDVNKVGRWLNRLAEDRYSRIELDRRRGGDHEGKTQLNRLS